MCECCKSVKRAFVNFRLRTCCCVASVRKGINIIAYCNVLVSAVSLLSKGRFSPIASGLQKVVSEEGTAIPKLVNITVILFNILLLIAVNKKIPVLLRVFLYYCIAKVVLMAIVVWPLIHANEDDGFAIVIVTAVSILFQFYIMLLVRSVIVEIKEEIAELNGKVPAQVIFTSQTKEAESGKVGEASVKIHMNADSKLTAEEPNKSDEILKTNELQKDVTNTSNAKTDN